MNILNNHLSFEDRILFRRRITTVFFRLCSGEGATHNILYKKIRSKKSFENDKKIYKKVLTKSKKCSLIIVLTPKNSVGKSFAILIFPCKTGEKRVEKNF